MTDTPQKFEHWEKRRDIEQEEIDRLGFGEVKIITKDGGKTKIVEVTKRYVYKEQSDGTWKSLT